jgi:hypothetical protein
MATEGMIGTIVTEIIAMDEGHVINFPKKFVRILQGKVVSSFKMEKIAHTRKVRALSGD